MDAHAKPAMLAHGRFQDGLFLARLGQSALVGHGAEPAEELAVDLLLAFGVFAVEGALLPAVLASHG